MGLPQRRSAMHGVDGVYDGLNDAHDEGKSLAVEAESGTQKDEPADGGSAQARVGACGVI